MMLDNSFSHGGGRGEGAVSVSNYAATFGKSILNNSAQEKFWNVLILKFGIYVLWDLENKNMNCLWTLFFI